MKIIKPKDIEAIEWFMTVKDIVEQSLDSDERFNNDVKAYNIVFQLVNDKNLEIIIK